MQNSWSEASAAEFVDKYGKEFGADLALTIYLARLVGAEHDLVLHGGGNSSVKMTSRDVFGASLPILYVKASGYDMSAIEPNGYTGLNLEALERLRALPWLDDRRMLTEFRKHLWNPDAPAPSIETLAHAFIPRKFIVHIHANAILALTNQSDGEHVVRQALGDGVLILDYVRPGFELAKAAADAFESNPRGEGMVWMRHGLLTWGDTARECYEATAHLVSRSEDYIARHARVSFSLGARTSSEEASERYARVAPLIRGLLARPSTNPDRPFSKMILRNLSDSATIDFLASDPGKSLALSAPLTADYLIRTKALPLWIDQPDFTNPVELRKQIASGLEDYKSAYEAYLARHAAEMPEAVKKLDPLPRVILIPGLGAVCAGTDVEAADIVKDITAPTLRVKAQIDAMGEYQGLDEKHLFSMEYCSLQHAKLRTDDLPLSSEVALISGAAGAIGSGIAQTLLEHGCHVAVTDLPGPHLDALAADLQRAFGPRACSVAMDVTDPKSVADAFAKVSSTFGGVDLVVVNAGIAHVASLTEMDVVLFRKLEQVNIEGTLTVLSEAGRLFKFQNTGGDVVMVSTKNVFAPGAKFGAYSATKAAAHQLARIASLELAEIGVRVNMVAPDAVFSNGDRKSGLWATVGPERMTARGLDAQGLEEYYRNRNLLKARVTARHVANAVLFFATRQTPTTGATLPVDGGLPDATPR